ncbi:hypothetical protein F511_37150 [Dorcoceras hygrometricum]|uniref:Uncharacterized protein n=1 Tax=Dorcoceras hygrometricum TaxID=472368 RepID=A0A2Z7BGV1_9LAMI|nr:hypothetical protein F511_37150 [Dorcoceras hygrometricum]
MQMDGDLVIYRTTLVRNFEVVLHFDPFTDLVGSSDGGIDRQRDRDFSRGPDLENDNRQPLKCQFPREIGRSQARRRQQATSDPDHASRRGSGRTKQWPGDDQYDKITTTIGCLDCYLAGNSCLAPTGFVKKTALHGRGGRYRQSGPRPKTGFLRQPALEGLTRSARTDYPRQDWPETIFRRATAAARREVE